MDSYNMTNDSSTTSSGGVIIQRRPSVIKAVPQQGEVIVNEERECETIDVVGFDEMHGVGNGLKTEEDGLETEQNGLKMEEDEEKKREREDSVQNGRRRSKRKREELVEKSESGEDDDWKPLGR